MMLFQCFGRSPQEVESHAVPQDRRGAAGELQWPGRSSRRAVVVWVIHWCPRAGVWMIDAIHVSAAIASPRRELLPIPPPIRHFHIIGIYNPVRHFSYKEQRESVRILGDEPFLLLTIPADRRIELKACVLGMCKACVKHVYVCSSETVVAYGAYLLQPPI